MDTIICKGNIPPDVKDGSEATFLNTNPSIVIVPCGRRLVYESVNVWKWFNLEEDCGRADVIVDTVIYVCAGETYNLNGREISKTGLYSDTIHLGDYDSIVNCVLVVNPIMNISLSAQIQEGETYNLNGFNQTTQGTYTLNLKTINGCDSIVTINLMVVPKQVDTIYIHDTVNITDTITLTEYIHDTIYITDTITLCAKVYTYIYATINAGETYLDYGFNESGAGKYTKYLQTIDGCDSIITLYLQVASSIDAVKQTEVITIYPNPASARHTGNSFVTIEGKGEIIIFNNKGQVIKTLDNSNNSINLDISDFARGVYYIKVGNITKKLVIE